MEIVDLRDEKIWNELILILDERVKRCIYYYKSTDRYNRIDEGDWYGAIWEHLMRHKHRETLITKLGATCSISDFKAYTTVMIKNQCKSFLRKKPPPEISIFGSDTDDEENGGLIHTISDQTEVSEPERRIDNDIVEATLLGIPENYAAILRLYYLEGKQQREIADLLGKNVKQMSVELNRARKAFSAELPTALIGGSTSWQRLFSVFVRKLSASECKIFAFKYVDKLKAKTIAEMVPCDVSEVTTQLVDIQRKLIKHIQNEF